MSDIFISYSSADRSIANLLADRLDAEGWTVFWDVQTPVGKAWDQAIENQLHTAKAVVVLWSARSLESNFVKEEAHYGRSENILFPAFIERVKPPFGFNLLQTANLIGWQGEPDHLGLAQLLDALRGHLGVGRQPIANGAIDESRHGDADLRPDKLATAVGRNKSASAGVSGEMTGQMPETVVARPYSGLHPIPLNSIAHLVPGQTFRDPLKRGGEGPLMVVIPSGRFLMGSPSKEPERSDDEVPQHEVIIQTLFALGVTAVTFAEYDLFCRNTSRELPSDSGWGRDNRPVINVSWYDAQAYCAWLSQQTGMGYRLPSEAEWEYACRAGTQTPFSFGNNITPEQVNYDGNHPYAGGKKGQFRQQTVPVQSLPPNAWGLYEMHGNVREWVQDAWHGNYNGAPTDGSAWEQRNPPPPGEGGVGATDTGAARVVRGGSWNYGARRCRSASRSIFRPVSGIYDTGFRCARVQVVS